MALFFNIDKLDKVSKDDSARFIFYLRQLYYKRIPNRADKYVPVKGTLHGSSFLLNPEPLFKECIDTVYIVQYVRLAAKRDYFMYKQYGISSLPLSYFPDLHINNIKHNPLLTFTEDSILFKHEK